jgi:exonuclease VII large subunit
LTEAKAQEVDHSILQETTKKLNEYERQLYSNFLRIVKEHKLQSERELQSHLDRTKELLHNEVLEELNKKEELLQQQQENEVRIEATIHLLEGKLSAMTEEHKSLHSKISLLQLELLEEKSKQERIQDDFKVSLNEEIHKVKVCLSKTFEVFFKILK